MLTLTVYGVPRPKGSRKFFRHGGSTESSRHVAGWMTLVASVASRVLAEQADPTIRTTPLTVSVAFYLPRPQRLKGDAAHTTRPDLDKLVRAVFDALTGVIWRDDAQVCRVLAAKQYAAAGAVPHVVIDVDDIAADSWRTGGTDPR